MRCLISIFILISVIGCAKPQCPEPPPPELITKYEKIKVPVYTNPLDNMTIQAPSKLNKFYFSDNGSLNMSEQSFKTMLNNFLLLKEERKYYYQLLKSLEN